MNIIDLKAIPASNEDKRLNSLYSQFQTLLQEIRKKNIPDSAAEPVNQEIIQLNASGLNGRDLRKQVKAAQMRILKQLEKQLKIVPQSHYRNMWLALGMAVFGLPIGLAFGLGIHNTALSGTGIPIGMAIGIAIGSAMDKKALEEGRQLDVEIKY